jgi:hypothetical protein
MNFGMAVMLLRADHVDITHEQNEYYPFFWRQLQFQVYRMVKPLKSMKITSAVNEK